MTNAVSPQLKFYLTIEFDSTFEIIDISQLEIELINQSLMYFYTLTKVKLQYG